MPLRFGMDSGPPKNRTVSFTDPNATKAPLPPPASNRSELMAWLLAQPQQQIQTTPELGVKLADRGLQVFLQNKAITEKKTQETQRATALANALFPEGDPRREQFLALAQAGAVNADSLGGPLVNKLFPEPGEPFTLGEGQTRYDANGRPVASGSPATRKAPQVETFYDDKGQEVKRQWNPDTQQWEVVGGAKAPSGTSLTVGPDGEVQFTQGNKPITESQSKDVVFVTRAAGALPLIDKYGDALTSLGENVAGQAPLIGNYMKTPEYQQAEQSGKEFLQAILRKDTGAAITKEETEEYGSVYLPRPGDSAPVLEQKKISRRRALTGIQNGLSPQAILQLERGGVDVPSQTGLPAAGGVAPAAAPKQLEYNYDPVTGELK